MRQLLWIMLGLGLFFGHASVNVADGVRRDPRPTTDDLATTAAVERGLARLATMQNPDGSWSNDIGNKLGYQYQVNPDGHGKSHVGVTAISCMAFMAAGNTPDRGKFSRNVRAGLKFVMDNVAPQTGWISYHGTRMYSHAFASMFLAEVYGMTRDASVLARLRSAVKFIADSQNEAGAWRYVPNQTDSDMSICVCQLQALRAAANVGVLISEETIEAAKMYVRRSYIRSRGQPGAFRYQNDWDGRSTFALTAAGVVALQSTGEYDSHTYYDDLRGRKVRMTLDLRRSIEFIQRNRPDRSDRGLYPGSYLCNYGFWYGHYYAAQAMHQYQYVSPKVWKDWNDTNRRHFLKLQHRNGAWTDEIGGWNEKENAYATAMACLILSIPRGFLPVFQS